VSLWRRSCAFRGCVIALAATVLVLVGPRLYLDWRTQRDMEAAFERIERGGYPRSPAELAPGPVPDDDNAAVLYQQVFRVEFDGVRSHTPFFETMPGRSVVQDYLAGKAGPSLLRPALSDPAVEEALDTLRRGSLRPTAAWTAATRGSTTSTIWT